MILVHIAYFLGVSCIIIIIIIYIYIIIIMVGLFYMHMFNNFLYYDVMIELL